MLVADRMSKPPVTVRDDTGVGEALSLMHSENVRRLPVVDKHGKMHYSNDLEPARNRGDNVKPASEPVAH